MPKIDHLVSTPLLDAVLDRDTGLLYEGFFPKYLEIEELGMAITYAPDDLRAFEGLAAIPAEDLPLQLVLFEQFLAGYRDGSNPLRADMRASGLHPTIVKASMPQYTKKYLSKPRHASSTRYCFAEPWLRRFVMAALRLRLAGDA